MPQIPQFNAPLPEVSPVNGTRYNPHMYDANAEAAAHMGQAVQQIGNQLFDFAQKKQDALNYAATVKAETRMRLEGEDFHNWTKTNPDADKWQPEIEARVKKVQEELFKNQGDFAPVVRERLKVQFGQWSDLTRKSTEVAASSRKLEDGIAANNELINLKVNQGDVKGAEELVHEGLRIGYYSPKVAESKLTTVKVQASLNKVNAAINVDPFEFYKNKAETLASLPALNDTHKRIIDINTEKAMNMARVEITKDWNRMVIGFQESGMLVDAKGDLLQMSDIYAQAEHAGISKSVVDRTFKPAKTYDAAGASSVDDSIKEYSPKTDKTSKSYWDLAQRIDSLTIPAQDKTYLRDKLEKKSLGQAIEDKNPAIKDFWQKAKRDYDDGLFIPYDAGKEAIPGSGFLGFGKDYKDVLVEKKLTASERAHWNTFLPKDEVEATDIHYSAFKDKMTDFFEKNPNANNVDINNYSKELMAPYLAVSVLKALTSQVKSEAKSPDDEARDWLNKHPNDPRNAEIKSLLGIK